MWSVGLQMGLWYHIPHSCICLDTAIDCNACPTALGPNIQILVPLEFQPLTSVGSRFGLENLLYGVENTGTVGTEAGKNKVGSLKLDMCLNPIDFNKM